MVGNNDDTQRGLNSSMDFPSTLSSAGEDEGLRSLDGLRGRARTWGPSHVPKSLIQRRLRELVQPRSIFHDFTGVPNGEVHVWSAALDLDGRSISSLEAVLSQDERCRADRFRFAKDYAEFVLARSLLRCLVGSYLHLEATRVQFVYSPFGKPAIHPDLEPEGLRFNVSHSHGEALFAFSHNREVGIDLEFIPAEWDGASLSQQFFSSRENEQLQTVVDIEKKHAFFRCWTRKEAYIKARGEGLSLELNQFDVSLLPAEKPALLEVRLDAQEVNRWKMQDVAVKSNYAGALVAEGHDWNVRQFRLTAKDCKCSDDLNQVANRDFEPLPNVGRR